MNKIKIPLWACCKGFGPLLLRTFWGFPAGLFRVWDLRFPARASLAAAKQAIKSEVRMLHKTFSGPKIEVVWGSWALSDLGPRVMFQFMAEMLLGSPTG